MRHGTNYLFLGIILAVIILFSPIPYYQRETCLLMARLDGKPVPCIPAGWRIGASLWQRFSGELQKSVSSYASGIYGTATIGPTCFGPGRPGEVCTKPYDGIIKVENQSRTEEITTVTTGSNGSFKVSLPPGNYYLVGGNVTGSPFVREKAVTVRTNSYTKADLNFDTGIR